MAENSSLKLFKNSSSGMNILLQSLDHNSNPEHYSKIQANYDCQRLNALVKIKHFGDQCFLTDSCRFLLTPRQRALHSTQCNVLRRWIFSSSHCLPSISNQVSLQAVRFGCGIRKPCCLHLFCMVHILIENDTRETRCTKFHDIA